MTRHDPATEVDGAEEGVGTPDQDTDHQHFDVPGSALAYAARGWPVFPLHAPSTGGCSCGRDGCSSPAKHPRTARGLHDATTDPDTIRRWWARWPGSNVGLPTGLAFDVLDLDGDDALDALDAAGPPPEESEAIAGPMVCTGRGIHVYLSPTGAGNRAGLADHVDWRGRGGYVVAPPSMHATGVRYVWGDTYGIDTPLRPAPDWLVDLVTRPKPTPAPVGVAGGLLAPGGTSYGLRALEGELGRLATAGEGTRNDALNAAALRLGQLVGGGELEAAFVVHELRTVATRIGLGNHETVATITSGMAKGASTPRKAA